MRKYRFVVLMFSLVLSASIAFAGGELDKDEMLEKLRRADIGTRMSDKTFITPKQSDMLTGEPISLFSMFVDLSHTSNIRVTAIEFDNQQLALEMDKKPINGFNANNWFFIGIVDKKSTQDIVDAIVK